MKSWGCWLGLIALIAVVSGGAYLGLKVGPVFSICEADGDMTSEQRREISDLGQRVVMDMRSGEVRELYELMSSEAKAATQLHQLAEASESSRSVRATGELTTRHVYRLFSLGNASGTAMCNTSTGAAFLARGGGSRTAFADVVEPINGAERSWAVWFQREGGEWRVRAFHSVISAVAGRDGPALWRLAKAESERGHQFNATLLYDVAEVALSRGPNMQPPEAEGFAAERRNFRRHPDLPGPAPLRFHLGEKEFPVGWLTVTGTGDGALMLVVDQQGEIASEAMAIERNREMIDAMNVYRPEWREVFDGIAVGYPTGDGGRVWRSVFTREGGYLEEQNSVRN